MSNTRTALIIAIIFISFLGCKEDPIDPLTTIITLDTMVPPEGGVIFRGELTAIDSIASYGFQYSKDSLFLDNSTVPLYHGKPTSPGIFESEVCTGLEINTVYYFRAFAKIEMGRLIYGVTKPFNSSGSKPPEIDRSINYIGHLGDTLKIRGNNFGSDRSYMRVSFSGKNAFVADLNDSVIICYIPKNLETYQGYVKVTTYDKSDSVQFKLYTPEIHSFQPQKATFRDTVEILGDHFDWDTDYVRVILGGKRAEIIFATRTRLHAIVSENLDKSDTTITVQAQLQEVESSTNFELTPPIVTVAPNCAHALDEIVLEGEYFHPIQWKNRVFIEGVMAEVVSGSTTSLTVKVPYGPFPRGIADIHVQVADLRVETGLSFCLEDAWLMVSNTLPFLFYGDVGTFIAGGTAYVISNSQDFTDPNIYLWEFNDTTFQWTQHTMPFPIDHEGTCTSNGNNGYVYTATSSNNFWEFNGTTRTWRSLPDFPGLRRGNAASFAIGTDIYLGVGGSLRPTPSANYVDFYRYYPGAFQWVQISDPPITAFTGSSEASSFTIGNEGYIVGGARNTGGGSPMKYIPATDKWEIVAYFPAGAYNYTSSFSLNGKGYVANGSPIAGSPTHKCWEYDATTDSWRAFDNIGFIGRFRGFAFVVNGKAYVGGGETQGTNYKDTPNEIFMLTK